MAGRPKIYDETDAIRKATAIFWKKGYEASSTGDLLAAMGIGKGSFYLHFKDGKRELFRRSLDLFSVEAMKRFNDRLSGADDEIKFLKEYFMSFADSTAEQRQKGCYLGNAIVEMSNIDPRLRAHAAALMDRLEQAFRNIIEKAQTSNRIKNRTDARLLAKYLINLRNGIFVTMRSENNKDDLKALIIQGLEIIQ